MGLNATDRDTLLSRWIQPSSDSEADRQARAERMVKNAINAHPAFADTSVSVYAKGSYANNTNVRIDSDVDIVVQCDECVFYEFAHGVTPPSAPIQPYAGEWTPELWRSEVAKAIVSHFGTDVDSSGNVAIRVPERYGSRPSTDVVPSFAYQLHWNAERTSTSDGSVVYPNSGARIVNWPQQQLEKGRTRNTATGGRYKRFVRALKNCENHLAASKVIGELPSYFMECLVWNASDTSLTSGTLDGGFRDTLLEIWGGLEGAEYQQWEEPNGIKYLFRPSQKWTQADALKLARAAWKLLYEK